MAFLIINPVLAMEGTEPEPDQEPLALPHSIDDQLALLKSIDGQLAEVVTLLRKMEPKENKQEDAIELLKIQYRVLNEIRSKLSSRNLKWKTLKFACVTSVYITTLIYIYYYNTPDNVQASIDIHKDLVKVFPFCKNNSRDFFTNFTEVNNQTNSSNLFFEQANNIMKAARIHMPKILPDLNMKEMINNNFFNMSNAKDILKTPNFCSHYDKITYGAILIITTCLIYPIENLIVGSEYAASTIAYLFVLYFLL
jgi:hypothetical protein